MATSILKQAFTQSVNNEYVPLEKLSSEAVKIIGYWSNYGSSVVEWIYPYLAENSPCFIVTLKAYHVLNAKWDYYTLFNSVTDPSLNFLNLNL